MLNRRWIQSLPRGKTQAEKMTMKSPKDTNQMKTQKMMTLNSHLIKSKDLNI